MCTIPVVENFELRKALEDYFILDEFSAKILILIRIGNILKCETVNPEDKNIVFEKLGFQSIDILLQDNQDVDLQITGNLSALCMLSQFCQSNKLVMSDEILQYVPLFCDVILSNSIFSKSTDQSISEQAIESAFLCLSCLLVNHTRPIRKKLANSIFSTLSKSFLDEMEGSQKFCLPLLKLFATRSEVQALTNVPIQLNPVLDKMVTNILNKTDDSVFQTFDSVADFLDSFQLLYQRADLKPPPEWAYSIGGKLIQSIKDKAIQVNPPFLRRSLCLAGSLCHLWDLDWVTPTAVPVSLMTQDVALLISVAVIEVQTQLHEKNSLDDKVVISCFEIIEVGIHQIIHDDDEECDDDEKKKEEVRWRDTTLRRLEEFQSAVTSFLLDQQESISVCLSTPSHSLPPLIPPAVRGLSNWLAATGWIANGREAASHVIPVFISLCDLASCTLKSIKSSPKEEKEDLDCLAVDTVAFIFPACSCLTQYDWGRSLMLKSGLLEALTVLFVHMYPPRSSTAVNMSTSSFCYLNSVFTNFIFLSDSNVSLPSSISTVAHHIIANFTSIDSETIELDFDLISLALGLARHQSMKSSAHSSGGSFLTGVPDTMWERLLSSSSKSIHNWEDKFELIITTLLNLVQENPSFQTYFSKHKTFKRLLPVFLKQSDVSPSVKSMVLTLTARLE